MNWAATTLPAAIWWSVASSADGTKLVAAVTENFGYYSNNADYFFGGPIYTSSDSGTTWTTTPAPQLFWSSVASSADGIVLVAAANPSPSAPLNQNVLSAGIYVSTNSGGAWIKENVPDTNWLSVATSADGGKLFAVVDGGEIWTSQATRPPRLGLALSPTNCALSWIMPSTNFVLQQSSDLISWMDTSNPPVLNLTNLQNQVSLPVTGCNRYFRLKTP